MLEYRVLGSQLRIKHFEPTERTVDILLLNVLKASNALVNKYSLLKSEKKMLFLWIHWWNFQHVV